MDASPLLSRQEAEVVHDASLRVLERTGIALDHAEARELLLAAGAREDADGRTLLPRALVTSALERARRSFALHDRAGEARLELAVGRTYFGPGSDALYQVDRDTGNVRESTLADVGANVRLADALGYDFVMSMALPRNLKAQQLYPRVFVEMVRNTARPLIVTAVSVDDVRHIHELGAQVAGGHESLRASPFFLVYVEPISPLRFDHSCVAKLLYCARQRLPFSFAAGANCGTGAPITPEGGVVQGSAESLAGLVIAMLASPDVKFVYGANTSSADMRSAMVCYGATEWIRTVAMYADMARFYGLPSWGTAGCTDAQRVDAQAAWEAYRGIVMALQAQPTLAHDMGYMAFGELYDRRMLALAREMLDEARHLLQPVELSEERLGTAVIDEVARSSKLYLAHPHTKRHYRGALWMSDVINRTKVGLGHEAMTDKLARRVERVLAPHQVPELEPRLDAELSRYVDELSD